MKIHFKSLQYQLNAVKAVADCFAGQPLRQGNQYMIDQGVKTTPAKVTAQASMFESDAFSEEEQAALMVKGKARKNYEIGFENAQIQSLEQVLKNIQKVQSEQGLEKSLALVTADNKAGKNLTSSPLNLDIEMETGTGKTYCYIRTMFELNKQYGWSKFIIVVPSIAIREGVSKSLEMTADHFQAEYGKKARFFIYDSKALHHLESFSSNNGVNVMIINVQAFNAFKEGANNEASRKIYSILDEFQSRRPIDVISKNRPILILDEPQKMGADKTLESLSNFKPLFILRYSATHKRNYNLVHRLDALDAYNQKLVKKITVKGIEVSGLTGTHGYMYLQDILLSKAAPEARLEIEIAVNNGFNRKIRKIKKGDNLYDLSNKAEQYHDRYVVENIDARDNSVTFLNGKKIFVGQALGHVDEKVMRTIQIRETIRAHIEKEQLLFNQGIKVLSLFFIDEVSKYRQYNDAGNQLDGEYAEIFKAEYQNVINEVLDLNLEADAYQEHLQSIDVDTTHKGYFSIDKNKRLVDPALKNAKDEELGVSVKQADDQDAYDLILKDKETLLSFNEPTRFIFSHSALREGWDNPNVFTICTLKHSDNVISRRQEVGRGLRLAVNQTGERMDANYFAGALGEVHKLNNLTVVTNESYSDFVSNLQTEIKNTLSSRPTEATAQYFTGKVLKLANGESLEITGQTANQIYRYLVKNDFVDDNNHITSEYREARAHDTLPALPEDLQPFATQIVKLIDSVFDPKALDGMIDNGNDKVDNQVNKANLERKEFQALWSRINRKAVYQIELDSEKLITNSISAIERTAKERNNNFVETLTYTLAQGSQKATIAYDELQAGSSFSGVETTREKYNVTIHSQVRYDLLGNIAEDTNLTRRTVARILTGINTAVFAQYKLNPEAFIREMSRIINEQQAEMVIQGLKYNPLQESYDQNEIFVTNKVSKQAFSANKHVLDFVATDSTNELRFVTQLDGASEVIVYAKLPDRFKIPTPFGSYNPDWAIAFDKDKVRQIYFVAETKGSMFDGDLRGKEKSKIACAKAFFETLNKENDSLGEPVKYDVVDSFASLMKLVS